VRRRSRRARLRRSVLIPSVRTSSEPQGEVFRNGFVRVLKRLGSASLSVLFDLIGCAFVIIHVDANEIGLGSWAECAGIGRRARRRSLDDLGSWS